jgi:uncharacterized protein YbjT (DUF2867 family)
MTTAALFGGTGFVGSHILSTLVGLDSIKAVHTVSRRAPKSDVAKLDAHVEEDNAKWASTLASIVPPPDVVFSSVGTTKASVGSIAEQWKIDHDCKPSLST